jgi:NAD(P)-dependent dehydrogenase (short-subunit alcohol dehydrogenase family)
MPPTNQRFTDQVVIVTGASRGIGRATAVAFGREGAKVIVNYNSNQAAAQETLDAIKKVDGQGIMVKANVGELDDCQKLVEAAISLGRVSVLVNNAAAFNRQHFFNVEMPEFDRLFNVNVRGIYFLSQLIGQHMADNGGGRIVHLSSILAQQAAPTRTVYCATKGAIEALTRAMALDLADFNVRVNAITPGLIETNAMLAGFPNEKLLNDVRDHIPAKRFGTPEELAQAILFIASTDASYINGTTLLVDGGLGAREAGPVF